MILHKVLFFHNLFSANQTLNADYFCANLKLILLFISLTSSLFIISCDSAVEPIIPEKILDTLYSSDHFLWPSQVGNYWTFQAYAFSNHFNADSNWEYDGFKSFGIDLDTVRNESSPYRLEIIDSIFVDINDTLYSCHVFDIYDILTEKYKNFKSPYWIGDDGIYNMGLYGERADTVLKKGLYIPSSIPLNIDWGGQITYKQYGYFHASPVIERKCISENEILKTPLGEVECYVIFTRIWAADDIAGYLDFYDYYAPDIGLICTVRLSVTPIFGADKYGWWWLNYISIINQYSIKIQ